MKKIQLSFFWRLLGAFGLCSIIPLFLLSVVFTSFSDWIIKRNNRQHALEIVSSSISCVSGLIDGAMEKAQQIAADNSVKSWCSNSTDVFETSRLISDIFQKNSELDGSSDYQLFIVRSDMTLSQGIIPEQYESSAYGTWGILNASRVNSDKAFFSQPHPGSGNNAIVAVCVPVLNVGGDAYGYVIIDILRNNLADYISNNVATKQKGQEFTKADLSGTLAGLYLYDKNYCILYSMNNLYEEGTFWNDKPSIDKDLLISGNVNSLTVCAVLPVSSTSRYIHDFRLMALIIGCGTGIVAFMIALFFTRSIAHPVQSMAKVMQEVESGNLEVKCPEPRHPTSNDEMTFLVQRFNIMIERIKKLMDDKMEQQRLLRVSEVKSLQAQISPHFLYNTLNSIKSMARLAGENNIARVVTSLGKILRASFTPGEDFCTVENSLELVKDYFDIETSRYEGRFSLSIDMEPHVLDYPIPRLIIQPIVENALVHGLEEKVGNGSLYINGKVLRDESFNADLISIVVRDDGCGMSLEMLQKLRESLASGQIKKDGGHLGSSGIALVNTDQRLKLLYGEKYGLSIDSNEGNGTTVEIKLPFNQPIGVKQDD